MNGGNLLILMSDEHQARALGCAGHFVNTPNLDRLAAAGCRFTNAYTPSPICVPARASFATGRYVHQTRLWDNAMPYSGQIPGWGHALQAKGVPVESIGKLHYRSEEDPAGFDAEHIPMMVLNGVGMVFASIRAEDERITTPNRMLGGYMGPGESKYTEYDAAVTERTIEWLREQSRAKAPWCLYVGLVAPHFPLICPPEFYELYPEGSLPEPKLHPRDGYRRHPWVEKQNAASDNEGAFADEQERLRAISAYYGLVSWLDSNVGKILDTLDETGLRNDTTVVYASDHGDNVGARGLWGKSNMYEESAAVPLICAGPGIAPALCHTPVSLLDLSETILDHFDAPLDGDRPGTSLYEFMKAPTDPDRAVFSEYHAIGAVSGCFMLRKGKWKYIHYVGFEPELFDLDADPEETRNLADDPDHAAILRRLDLDLRAICHPEEQNERAFDDQRALVEACGGREKALAMTGAGGGTPPPDVAKGRT